MMTIVEDWSAVMADVQGIRKADVNRAQGFTFRGIDAVMNAVGPALRRHGVIVVPVAVTPQRRDIQTARGTMMHEVVVTVTYRVTGKGGDSFEMQSVGEAMDAGDKATAKAMSVAYRTALLQSLTIPTDEPDPDEQVYARQAPDLKAAKNRIWGLIDGSNDDEKLAMLQQLASAKQVRLDDAAGLNRLSDELEGVK